MEETGEKRYNGVIKKKSGKRKQNKEEEIL